MKARLLFWEKHSYADGAIREMKLWAVPRRARTQEGVKYSLVYINPEGVRLLGYDNAHGLPHRHLGEARTPFYFEFVEDLVERFLKEVEILRRIEG